MRTHFPVGRKPMRFTSPRHYVPVASASTSTLRDVIFLSAYGDGESLQIMGFHANDPEPLGFVHIEESYAIMLPACSNRPPV